METPDHFARLIRASLAEIEATHRQQGRNIAGLHRQLAAAVAQHGATMGLDDAFIVQAAAPKEPPTNPGD